MTIDTTETLETIKLALSAGNPLETIENSIPGIRLSISNSLSLCLNISLPIRLSCALKFKLNGLHLKYCIKYRVGVKLEGVEGVISKISRV